MRRRYLLKAVLISCILFAGCGAKESTDVAQVYELPIEASTESPESTENTEQKAVTEVLAAEPVQFEDVEVEVNGNEGTILVGTTGAPYTELLTQVKIKLAEAGWNLQIKYYDDAQKLNEDVLNSVLDAHLFAHQTYIDSYNYVNKTELVSAAPVCYEVYGVYSKLNDDLTDINGAVIALPQEAEQKARALLFMHDLGWIVLQENVGMTAILEDIVANEKNLQFTEYTPDTFAEALEESDYCIAGGDTAIINGLSVEEDAIRTETANGLSAGIYATVLVTTQEKAEDAKIKLLADTLVSEEIKEYMGDTYRGALELMR